MTLVKRVGQRRKEGAHSSSPDRRVWGVKEESGCVGMNDQGSVMKRPETPTGPGIIWQGITRLPLNTFQLPGLPSVAD
ncbi:hypothetical protein E2C01_043317 [Portunus trituberculatus]|uniref:Uncharacterized protein n=1 Tax=Portunus trituberculatus TaxID=210409 RepID=A0A5B7FZ86_PORTR|nr:hypothetical protein [Portunus trituberculatus]